MPLQLEFGRALDAPAARVWALITDTRTWPDWGPTVRAVDCRQRFIRENSHGRVQTPLGFWLPFRVTAFEPDTYWDWQVAGVGATGHRIAPLDHQRCRLSFTVPAWAFVYGSVCRLALMRIDRLLRSRAQEKCS
jgi:uncharacterized protein YndB with AHSA1/START domain